MPVKKDKDTKLQLRRPKLTLTRLTTRDLLRVQGGRGEDGQEGVDTTGSGTCSGSC